MNTAGSSDAEAATVPFRKRRQYGQRSPARSVFSAATLRIGRICSRNPRARRIPAASTRASLEVAAVAVLIRLLEALRTVVPKVLDEHLTIYSDMEHS